MQNPPSHVVVNKTIMFDRLKGHDKKIIMFTKRKDCYLNSLRSQYGWKMPTFVCIVQKSLYILTRLQN